MAFMRPSLGLKTSFRLIPSFYIVQVMLFFSKRFRYKWPLQLSCSNFSCYSKLGYIKRAAQRLSIGRGCEEVSISYKHGTSY